MSRKFEDGDRVIVSDIVVDGSDKKYSGKVGTIESFNHSNGDLEVYSVLLDGDDYSHAFYDADLLPYGELEALRVQLAKAEAEVEKLKEAIRLKGQNATELPVGTVVSYKDIFGHAVITKQSEDNWLNIFPTSSGNQNTERVTDYRVNQLLSRSDATIRKP